MRELSFRTVGNLIAGAIGGLVGGYSLRAGMAAGSPANGSAENVTIAMKRS